MVDILVPFFAVVGVIATFRFFFRRSQSDNDVATNYVVKMLEDYAAESPNNSVSEFLVFYRRRMHSTTPLARTLPPPIPKSRIYSVSAASSSPSKLTYADVFKPETTAKAIPLISEPETIIEATPPISESSIIAEVIPLTSEPKVDEEVELGTMLANMKTDTTVSEYKILDEQSPQSIATERTVLETPRPVQSVKRSSFLERQANSIPDKHHEAFVPEKNFSWRNWYSDHSINLLLYLGAFLVVAAVSLFVTFQWSSFASYTRFGLVIGFTIAWYIAGFAIKRVRSLDTIGITFITIGAVLTPFCGFAWQRFVIDSMDGLGWTWFITAIASTVIYIGLSLVYRRTYFTYFGNLSILAMLLAIVQINEAPQTYFIFAGACNALVLLIGRWLLRYFSQLETYFSKDVERSSMGSLLLSLGFGLFMLVSQGMSFISVDILAIVLVTVLYLWIYLSLHGGFELLLFSHFLTTFASVYAMMVAGFTPITILFGGLITYFVLQYFIERHVAEHYPAMLLKVQYLLVLVAFVVYLINFILPSQAVNHLLFGTILLIVTAVNAVRLDDKQHYQIVAILSYLVLGHLMTVLIFPLWAFLTGMIALATVQLLLSYLDLKPVVMQICADTGAVALLIIAVFLVIRLPYFTQNDEWLPLLTAILLVTNLGLGVVEWMRSEKRLSHWMYAILPTPIGISVFLYTGVDFNWFAPFFLLGFATLCFVIYHDTKNIFYAIVMCILPYVLFFELLFLGLSALPFFTLVVIGIGQLLLSYLYQKDTNLSRINWLIAMIALGILGFIYSFVTMWFSATFEWLVVVTIASIFFLVGITSNHAPQPFLPRASRFLPAVGFIAFYSIQSHATFLPVFMILLMGVLLWGFYVYESNQGTASIYLGLEMLLSYLLAYHVLTLLRLLGVIVPVFMVLASLQLIGVYTVAGLSSDDQGIVGSIGLLFSFGLIAITFINNLSYYPLIGLVPVYGFILWREYHTPTSHFARFVNMLIPMMVSIIYLMAYVSVDPWLYGIITAEFALIVMMLAFLCKNDLALVVLHLLVYGILLRDNVLNFSLLSQEMVIITGIIAGLQVTLAYSKLPIRVRSIAFYIGLIVLILLIPSLYLLDYLSNALLVTSAFGWGNIILSYIILSGLLVIRYRQPADLGLIGKELVTYVGGLLALAGMVGYFILNQPFAVAGYSLFITLICAIELLAISRDTDADRRLMGINPTLYMMLASIYSGIFSVMYGISISVDLWIIGWVGISLVTFVIGKSLQHRLPVASVTRNYALLILAVLIAMGLGRLPISQYTLYWLASYLFLIELWYSPELFINIPRRYVFSALGLVQYYWHLYYMMTFVNPELFRDWQWYTVAPAFVLLGMDRYDQRQTTDEPYLNLMELVGISLFIVPTLIQRFVMPNGIYTLLVIGYGILFVGYSIVFQRRLALQVGIVAIITSVFIEVGDYLMSLPRWLWIGTIGLGLIFTAMYLSFRRRTSQQDKKHA